MIPFIAVSLLLFVPAVAAQDDAGQAERARIEALRVQGDQALSRAMQDGKGPNARAVDLRIASLRYDDAARRLERALEVDSPALDALRASAKAMLDRRIETRVLLARTLIARGSVDAAAAMLIEVRRLKPGDVRVVDLTAQLTEAKKAAAGDGGAMTLGHVAGESPFGFPPRPTDNPVWDRQREGRQPPPGQGAPGPGGPAPGAGGGERPQNSPQPMSPGRH